MAKVGKHLAILLEPVMEAENLKVNIQNHVLHLHDVHVDHAHKVCKTRFGYLPGLFELNRKPCTFHLAVSKAGLIRHRHLAQYES